MKTALQVGFAAAVLLSLPSLVQAQHPPRIAAPAPSIRARRILPGPMVHSRAIRSTGFRTTTANSTSINSDDFSNSFVFTGGAPLSVQDLLNPVPGLGFDFTHLAAINRDLDLKAFIDPATQARLAVAERLLRESPGLSPGFLFLDGGGSYALPAPAEQQPQIIIVQPPVPAAAASAPEPVVAPEPEETHVASAPLPDEGEFTLVLRNGTKIQAVAFTRVNDKVVYITTEGTRRTIAAKDLDSEATLRINQERGTPLQLPL